MRKRDIDRMSSSNRIFDRMLGIFITLGAGLAMMTARKVLRRLMEDTKRAERNKKGKGRTDKGNESTEGDEYYKSRNTHPPNHIHNGSCHCQRIRFRLKAPKEIFAVDVPSKIRYPRVSLSVESFEPLSDEHIMSMYAVKSVDSGLGIHTFCSYCGMHVLFAPSTNPHEVQVNVDCLERTNISKVYVTYMATQDSVPVPSDYSHAQPYNRRGSGAIYNKVSGSGNGGGGMRGKDNRERESKDKDSYAAYGGLIALEDATRYASPDGKGKGGSRGDPYQNFPYSTPPTASSNSSNSGISLSKRDSSAMSGLFSEMTRWLSPFSKLKQAAVKQKEANEACESYFETYYGAAGANSDDYAVDAYNTLDNLGMGVGIDHHGQAQAEEQYHHYFQQQQTQSSPGDSRFRTRFNMSSGIGMSGTTPLQKQLNLMKHNLSHHLTEGEAEEENAVFNRALRHVGNIEELASM